ncbi:hypothetical protein TIFTF001_029825 [Ficus carica]|uniref:Uncharacterized protein n=1 Tax=Ficus carica TaxID=3494 RepID=A0AA88DSH7_FICCA|nr:hypothetical protein TIFTF001_029825 [Ficus carica]
MLVNERDTKGNNPLHLAAERAHPKVVSILTWDLKVNLGLMNQRGMTALDVAENYSGKVPSIRLDRNPNVGIDASLANPNGHIDAAGVGNIIGFGLGGIDHDRCVSRRER